MSLFRLRHVLWNVVLYHYAYLNNLQYLFMSPCMYTSNVPPKYRVNVHVLTNFMAHVTCYYKFKLFLWKLENDFIHKGLLLLTSKLLIYTNYVYIYELKAWGCYIIKIFVNISNR